MTPFPGRKYTEQQRTDALALYETHGPTAVQQRLGIPKSTVRKWARLAGRATRATARTHAATEAAAANAAHARAQAATATIHAANHAVTVLHRRLTTEAATLPLRDLAIIAGILIDKHVLLARLDQTDGDHATVDAWLAHILGGGPDQA